MREAQSANSKIFWLALSDTQRLFAPKRAIETMEVPAHAKLLRGLKVSFITQVLQEKENEHNQSAGSSGI
jgi:hypothetical protein